MENYTTAIGTIIWMSPIAGTGEIWIQTWIYKYINWMNLSVWIIFWPVESFECNKHRLLNCVIQFGTMNGLSLGKWDCELENKSSVDQFWYSLAFLTHIQLLFAMSSRLQWAHFARYTHKKEWSFENQPEIYSLVCKAYFDHSIFCIDLFKLT